ncbi:MAG: YdcF family protein [Roseiarcus sp.]
MFFVFSKLLWLAAAPSNVIALMIGVGVLATATRFRRAGFVASAVGAAALLACGFGPVGIWILRPLEDRFERPGADLAAPDGIIVLGGAIKPAMLRFRGALVPDGARMTEAVALARRFPRTRIVFTGGSSNLLSAPMPEADAARQFFAAMDLPPERMIYETRARNTIENAALTRALVSPKPGEHWLLVTSAFHMPRAVGVFRHAGFDVIAWPADYLSLGGPNELATPIDTVSGGLRLVDVGAREWIGLVAYRLSGAIDDLLPGPI